MSYVLPFVALFALMLLCELVGQAIAGPIGLLYGMIWALGIGALVALLGRCLPVKTIAESAWQSVQRAALSYFPFFVEIPGAYAPKSPRIEGADIPGLLVRNTVIVVGYIAATNSAGEGIPMGDRVGLLLLWLVWLAICVVGQVKWKIKCEETGVIQGLKDA